MIPIGTFFYNNKALYQYCSQQYAPGSAYIAQKELIMQQIPAAKNQGALNSFESVLNNLVYNKPSPYNSNISQQAFDAQVRGVFKALTGFNYQTLADGHMDTTQRKFQPFSNVKIAQQTIQQLLNIIDIMISSGKVKEEYIARYQAEVKKLQNMIDAWSKNSSNLKPFKLDPNAISKDTLQEILRWSSVGEYEAQGTLFETIISAASEMIQDTKNTSVKKIVQNIKGRERSGTVVNLNNVTDEVHQTIAEHYQIDEYNSVGISKNKSQDKLDVSINWRGSQLNVSAKAYKQIGHMGVARDFPLWAYVMNDNGAFINHWISLLNMKSPPQTMLTKYQQLMKYGLLIKSMVGSQKLKGHADTFIVQDKTGNHIYVRSMHELLQPLSRELSKIDEYVSYGKSYPQHLKRSQDFNGAFAQLRGIVLRASIHFDKMVHIQKS